MADGSTRTPEFELPLACVNRVLKAALPGNFSLTKETRLAFARAVGVFVFYLTHCASEVSRDSKRQTIVTNDVIKALK
jgi:DNA polymerase epsilon subunit 3